MGRAQYSGGDGGNAGQFYYTGGDAGELDKSGGEARELATEPDAQSTLDETGETQRQDQDAEGYPGGLYGTPDTPIYEIQGTPKGGTEPPTPEPTEPPEPPRIYYCSEGEGHFVSAIDIYAWTIGGSAMCPTHPDIVLELRPM